MSAKPLKLAENGTERAKITKEVERLPVQKQVIQLHVQKLIEMLEAYVEHDAGAALK